MRYLCLLCLLYLTGCAHLGVGFEDPSVKLVSIRLLPPQGLGQRFELGLAVSNPNPVPLPVQGMSYSLMLNGYEVLEGVTSRVPNLMAYEETAVTLQASTDLIASLRLVNDLLRGSERQEIEYTLKVKLDLAGIRQSLSVVQSGQVPLIKP